MNGWISYLQEGMESLSSETKVLFLALGGISAALLTSDVVANTVIALVAIFALVWYRLKRKFKEGKVAGAWDFLDRNIVELGLILTALPNGWKVASEVLRTFGYIH